MGIFLLLALAFFGYIIWLGVSVTYLRNENKTLSSRLDMLSAQLDNIVSLNNDPELEKQEKEATDKAAPWKDSKLAEELSQESYVATEITAEPEKKISPIAQKPKQSRFKSVEENISSRWMIWLGGIAFAIGGGFLVKYSIDSGLLSPGVRVTLGTIIGIAMAIGGEGIRQRREKQGFLSEYPDYVPGAISAAGLFTAFAAIYASYALYDLVIPILAFAVLALLSFGSTILSYFHGRFFAYLGMVAGLLVPALVSTGSGNAWTLFPYLLVIVGSCLWVSRKKAWTDSAATALVLALLWVILWIFTNWNMGDVIPVGIYLLILGGLNAMLLSGASPERSRDLTLKGLIPTHPVTIISDCVALLCIILLVSIVRIEHYSMITLILLSIWLIGQAYAVHRHPENDVSGALSIFGLLFLIATWHVPNLFEIETLSAQPLTRNTIWSPIVPPGFQTFTTACVIFTVAINVAIFNRLPYLARPALWASLGNFLSLAVIIIAYFHLGKFEASIPFSILSAILALILTFGATVIAKHGLSNAVLSAYAAGATTAISLAITMILRDAWLSFGLALELVALGYIWQKTRVVGLRHLALLLAGIILIRLFLNASVFDYQPGPLPLINWLFYGYGLTAGLFFFASKIFGQNNTNDRLMTLLRAGSIILLISFITLEIRALFSRNNQLDGSPTDLEIALQTVNWSVATTVLMWREIVDKDQLLGKLRRIMTLIAIAGLLSGGALSNNIFFDNVDLGPLIILNLQFVQFLIPAALYAIKAYLAYTAGKTTSLKLYGTVAAITLWFWLSAEVRHAYHSDGRFGATSDWEAYTYSLVWLLYAIGVLLFGLKRNIDQVRMAGLGILSIVVLKVFIIDMSSLEGLARALSFMGLGGALIGIGYLYQRTKVATENNISENS